MIEPSDRRQYALIIHLNTLRQHHPVLLPLILLSCSAILGFAGFFADMLFPFFMLIDIPLTPCYFMFAFVLGVSGILSSIIGIIEYIDRLSAQAAMFPKPKEHSYANRH